MQVQVLQEQAKRPKTYCTGPGASAPGAQKTAEQDRPVAGRQPLQESTNSRDGKPSAKQGCVMHHVMLRGLVKAVQEGLAATSQPNASACRPTDFTDLQSLIANDKFLSTSGPAHGFARCRPCELLLVSCMHCCAINE